MAGAPGEGKDEEAAVSKVLKIRIEEPTGVAEGSKIPTLAEMLGEEKGCNPNVFTDRDWMIINSIYPNDNDIEGKVAMLFRESVDNIIFPKEPQTPNFQKLVELGLFEAKTTRAGAPLVGRLCMTKKCADFLQTDLGAIMVWGEIMTIKTRLKDEIAGLTNSANDQIKLLHFFAGIISTEPKIQEICPPGSDLIWFLRELMPTFSFLNSTKKSLPKSSGFPQHWENMEKLGWIEPSEDENATMAILLTKQGRNRLTAYTHLFK